MQTAQGADGTGFPVRVDEDRGDHRTIAAVLAAHFASHVHILVLPPLLPLLRGELGASFVELGLALTVFNVVTMLTQAPMGFLVDTIGPKGVLTGGLLLGGAAFASIALIPTYPWLLVAAGLAGAANSVYHPADYAILTRVVPEERLGRVFSLHLFAGYFGGAVAPTLVLSLAGVGGARLALVAAGALALAAAALVVRIEGFEGSPRSRAIAQAGGRRTSLLTPRVFGLIAFYGILNLSTIGIQAFGLIALPISFGVSLWTANLALSAFLFAMAAGVLAGGVLADRTRRHDDVAAVGFALSAALTALVIALRPGELPLVVVLAAAGFVIGAIQPSRDMIVRRSAPPGAAGRIFGIVSTGFNIGGAIGPLLFGWVLDHGRPDAIFHLSAAFMVAGAACALLSRRGARRGAVA